MSSKSNKIKFNIQPHYIFAHIANVLYVVILLDLPVAYTKQKTETISYLFHSFVIPCLHLKLNNFIEQTPRQFYLQTMSPLVQCKFSNIWLLLGTHKQ